VMQAIRKDQLLNMGNVPQTPAEQFYSLAVYSWFAQIKGRF
jgi:hypothetical protein